MSSAGPLVPAAPKLPGEVLADPGPDDLGVDEDAVEVEDDRVEGDQAPVCEDRSMATRSLRPPISALTTSPAPS